MSSLTHAKKRNTYRTKTLKAEKTKQTERRENRNKVGGQRRKRKGLEIKQTNKGMN